VSEGGDETRWIVYQEMVQKVAKKESWKSSRLLVDVIGFELFFLGQTLQPAVIQKYRMNKKKSIGGRTGLSLGLLADADGDSLSSCYWWMERIV
jgi:hypothetical protein